MPSSSHSTCCASPRSTPSSNAARPLHATADPVRADRADGVLVHARARPTGVRVRDGRRYYGQKGALQFIVPIKWALDDLQLDCRPSDRMVTSARNYEAMQQIAAEFQSRALQMVTLLQQPVPLAYYHILKLMQVGYPTARRTPRSQTPVLTRSLIRCGSSTQVLVNLLISYAFLNIFIDEWWVSVITYAVVTGMLLGLQVSEQL